MRTDFINNEKIRHIHAFKFIFAIFIVIYLFRWQVIDAAKFEDIKNSRAYTSEITSLRGSIYSADGTTLAYSEPRFDLYIWMNDLHYFEYKELQTREEFVTQIAQVIEIDPVELEAKIAKYSEDLNVKWFRVARQINSEQWSKILDLKTSTGRSLRGYAFVNTSIRKYPEGSLASHVLGLTNVHNETYMYGVGGLEGAWNGILKPVKGLYVQEDNAVGEVVTSSLIPTIEPEPGSSIYTSIDTKLQKIIEEKIKLGVEEFDADTGTIIIMDPKTGEINAMANYPTYDPNTREAEASVYGNIAITSPYETGSTGKVMTIAAAVDLGLINPDTIIMPEGHQGCEKIHRDLQPLCTWDKRPQPPMPAKDCFSKSDNICFYHISKLMDKRDFYNYLVDFGIGSPTGIDLAGESYGPLREPGNWTVGDVAAFSYGHGYLANAVQSLNSFAVIANKGVRMQPYIVKKVVDSDGNEKIFEPIALDRAINEDSSETVLNMMRQIYLNSIVKTEYYYQHLKQYDIAMKSGTALIANSEGYTTDINASYIGCDASEQRTFCMIVKLEDPKIPAYDRLSFYNARMVWLDTFDAIKDHLNVPKKTN